MGVFTDEQIEAIEWFKGPLLVIGTPGSGKTTVIVNRINNLIYAHGVLPGNILVITFTRAAAASMRERFLAVSELEDTRVRFGTFHSFFYWIIRTAYGGKADIKVLDENDKRNVIRRILLEINKDLYDNEDTITSVINQMSIMSCDMIDIDNYYSTDMSGDDYKKLYTAYCDFKKREGFLDFDDMITHCYRLLSSRSDILESIRNMYPYIMVDEFQDTNLIQYRILSLLAHPNDNIYVVGDDDQSIYSFRGARPDIMHSFERDFPGGQVVRLSQNFRCPQTIVDASAVLINGNSRRFDKKLISAVNESGHVYLDIISDVSKENELIVSRIKEAKERGVSLKNIAVLYRTNMGPRRLIYKLREYNIAYNIRDALPDIFSHPVVESVVNYIAFALGDNRRSLFLSFMNKPVRYISRAMLTSETVDKDELMRAAGDKDYVKDKIRRLYNELRTISSLSPYAAVNYIREAIGYNNYLRQNAEEKNSDIDEMMDILDDFQAMTKDLNGFGEFFDMIDDYRKMTEKQSKDNKSFKNDENAVQLMTLHSAKGLEFEEVHILDVVEGVIPHKKSKTRSELEEERRMLYVGMTRSCRNLYMYVPRIIGDKPRTPSRFLEEINNQKNRG
ncbi:MAG: ATP-dependent helicase [Eubacterium sp.]|nr:ATP-dependent helicase [Eubacterium sp.]